MASSTDVLVIGAGPVGLSVAVELARRGVDCRIVDRRPTPRPGTRGCTVWQRTLEVFDLMGLPVADYLAAGSHYGYRTFHLQGHPAFTHDRAEPGTRYATPLIIGQHATEAMLTKHLEGLGVKIERGQTATSVRQDADGVTVELTGSAGDTQTIRAGWVVAAQGPHSTVRDAAGIGWPTKHFPGTALLQVDARIRGELPGDPAHCHMFMTDAGSLGTAPLPDGRVRLYAGVVDADPSVQGDPDVEEVQAAVRAVSGIGDLELYDGQFNWRVRLRNSVAETFRVGRCLIAGDTAHTVMPVTAQGMNTGIQEAFNLGWKLATVVRAGREPDGLLDTYESERRPVATALAERTEKTYWGGVGPTPPWHKLYERLLRLDATPTGLRMTYPDSPLNVEAHAEPEPAGARAGQRAPDGVLGDGTRLYDRLRSGRWTLLIFPAGPVPILAPHAGVKAHVVSTRDDPDGGLRAEYGAQRGGLYLIRPDSHIGFRGDLDAGAELDRYLARVS